MHTAVRAAALAFGVAAIAAPAVAATPPPPPYMPHAVLEANIGEGGNQAFTGVDDRDTGQLCYMLYASDVANPTGAFIRDNKSNKAVVNLAVPTGGTSGGCADIGKDLAGKLASDPDDYSVHVASSAYPDGTAAWGKLMVRIPVRTAG